MKKLLLADANVKQQIIEKFTDAKRDDVLLISYDSRIQDTSDKFIHYVRHHLKQQKEKVLFKSIGWAFHKTLSVLDIDNDPSTSIYSLSIFKKEISFSFDPGMFHKHLKLKTKKKYDENNIEIIQEIDDDVQFFPKNKELFKDNFKDWIKVLTFYKDELLVKEGRVDIFLCDIFNKHNKYLFLYLEEIVGVNLAGSNDITGHSPTNIVANWILESEDIHIDLIEEYFKYSINDITFGDCDSCESCECTHSTRWTLGICADWRCLRCDPGYKQVGEGCTLCSVPTFADYNSRIRGSGYNTCWQCTTGRYMDTSAPNGWYLNANFRDDPSKAYGENRPPTGSTWSGRTAKGICIRCEPGKYRYMSDWSSYPLMHTCQECIAGTYSNTYGATVCQACQQGYYQSNAGQRSCIRCPAGKYANSTSIREADGSANSNQITSSAGPCIDCAIGKYITSNDSVNWGISSCLTCTAGRYTTDITQSCIYSCEIEKYSPNTLHKPFCIPCDKSDNFYNTNDATGITPPTFAGYQTSTGQGFCNGCGKGTYPAKNANNNWICRGCSIGKYQQFTLSKFYECTKCTDGKYNEITNSETPNECVSCNKKNEYTPSYLQPCIPCAVGEWSPIRNPVYYCNQGLEPGKAGIPLIQTSFGAQKSGNYIVDIKTLDLSIRNSSNISERPYDSNDEELLILNPYKLL